MTRRKRLCLFGVLPVLLVLFAACRPEVAAPALVVTLVVDGRERALPQDVPITVGEILRRENIEVGDLDEVSPPPYSQITDGTRIVVTRIREETECDEEEVPFQPQIITDERLVPGERRLVQPGQSGVDQVCYRVSIRDGVRQQPIPYSRVSISAPQDEIVYVGPSGELDPVTIDGTIAYISNGNVWMIRGSSTNKRPLTETNDVDGRAFCLDADGRHLVYSRQVTGADSETLFNQLWLIADTFRNSAPVQLLPDNILSACWVPGQPNTISYSTGEVTGVAPGWRANNDLFLLQIDPTSGQALNVTPYVAASSFGLYNWWGTVFQWSPTGRYLAWVRADSMGVVDPTTRELRTLLSYPVFETRQSWSWRATVSFSPDESLLLTTVHGAPLGNELPQTSPAFDVAITDVNGTFSAEVAPLAGIWSQPRFAPVDVRDATGRQAGEMAYLRARDVSNSINDSAEYDLMLADRDGSNARVLFPPSGEAGANADARFTWSPDGAQIALIYQGNLWIVDVLTGVAHQLTLDGQASQPVWTP